MFCYDIWHARDVYKYLMNAFEYSNNECLLYNSRLSVPAPESRL